MAFASHEQYFASVSPEARRLLQSIRAKVEALLPNASRCISYNMPAYRHERVFFYFAAFKNHIGIYPPVKNAVLVRELAPYRGDKGNLSFALNEALPLELIGRVAVALSKEHASTAKKGGMTKPTSSGSKSSAAADAESRPPILFEDRETWFCWLRKNHTTSSGVWLRIAKKGAIVRSVSHLQAVDAALCFGWIDGQKKSDDESYWLQRFTPRSAKSIWSKINREKAIRLIELGQMNAAGLREVERAKRDGRWDRAYDSPSGATMPADFQVVLDKSPRAKAFFATLDSRNRYAMLFRIQSAKKAETRAKRIRQFAEMLSQREKIYPAKDHLPK